MSRQQDVGRARCVKTAGSGTLVDTSTVQVSWLMVVKVVKTVEVMVVVVEGENIAVDSFCDCVYICS